MSRLTSPQGYTNSNDAITISLVAPSSTGVRKLHSFSPKFTYPIFGDEEQIFGYKGLNISLRYNISDLRPNLNIKYDKKTKPIGDEEPLDINAVLEDFLPKSM
jgi:histone acetyltransferase 1